MAFKIINIIFALCMNKTAVWAQNGRMIEFENFVFTLFSILYIRETNSIYRAQHNLKDNKN